MTGFDNRITRQLGVEAVSDLELRITLEQPVPYFLSLLTHPSMFPVHPASVAEHGDQHSRAGNLVSNGAYPVRVNEKRRKPNGT